MLASLMACRYHYGGMQKRIANSTWDGARIVTITVEEIKERQVAALKAYAESMVLERWYGMLLYALEQEGVSDISQLDFSSHWFGGDYDMVTAIRDFKMIAGLELDEDQDALVTNFIDELLGDQLVALGVKPRRVWVSNGIDDAYWVFMLKPGQEYVLNPERRRR